MKITITTQLTPGYVMENAHSRYWFNNATCKKGRGANGEWPRFNRARLAKGLALVPTLKNKAIVGALLAHDGMPDGEALDVLLQLSLFGRVIYG